MLMLDIPPMVHRYARRHQVIARDQVDHKPPRMATGALPRLSLTHHECLTCGKLWKLDEL